MSITEQEKNDLLEKLNIIIDQDSYIDNSVISYIVELDKIEYITGDLLIQLLSTISLNKESENYLIGKLFNEDIISYRLLFYVSCNYGLLDNFIILYESNNFINNFRDWSLLMELFCIRYIYFFKFFNEKQLSLFLKILKRDNVIADYKGLTSIYNTSNVLIKIIVNHRFDELSRNFIGINIEINKDKEEIKQIVNYFGFDTKYNEFLTDLDRHFYSENKDNIEIAGLIGTFRQFNHDIIIDIALEVAKIDGLTDIPKIEGSKSTKQIGFAGDYLKEKFGLSSDEEKFLEYFTKILHEEGGHSFLSTIEYFRLTKNITIEIILLLLYKLRELKENSK